ncbi:MAG: hypothetical protein ACK4SU_06740, partial [Dictyoglomus sp.]
INNISKALVEQAVASSQIAKAIEAMRKQIESIRKGLSEQVISNRTTLNNIDNIAKEIKFISEANKRNIETLNLIYENIIKFKENKVE